MNWEEKLQALQALGETRLAMRRPGNWYVDQRGVEVGGDGMLAGLYGEGEMPINAVDDHWKKYVTNLPADKYIVIGAYTDKRRQVRWNGFMWEDVQR
jgi:hypothetical protein